jgi:hypothetical protein
MYTDTELVTGEVAPKMRLPEVVSDRLSRETGPCASGSHVHAVQQLQLG